MSALFVYGTLHPERAPVELAGDVKRFLRVGDGTIPGELREIDGYPAVRVGEGFDGVVMGTVFEVPEDAALWKRLDDYEGSLYVRRLLPVTMVDGQERVCWVYVYG